MLFAGSAFKDQCSRFWNSAVVALDKKIRTATPFGFFPPESKLSLIQRYFDSVMSLLNTIQRKRAEHDDQDNVTAYVLSTILQTQDDLIAYHKLRILPDEPFRHYIERLKLFASQETTETSPEHLLVGGALIAGKA